MSTETNGTEKFNMHSGIIIVIIVLCLWFLYYWLINETEYELEKHSNEFFSTRKRIHTMPASEFEHVTINVQNLIIKKIMDFSKKCQRVNGDVHEFKLEANQHVLSCYNDYTEIEKDTYYFIGKYLIDYVANKYDITMSLGHTYNILSQELSLSTQVIVPIMYSDVYATNGIQYFNKHKLALRVNAIRKEIRNAVFTIFVKRGIIVQIDRDDVIN